MLTLYNTLTKKKEVFTPLEPPRVTLYTCGPTVYGAIHIGNLRAYMTADTLRRTLSATGFTVRQVKNITDVGHLTADDIAQGDSGEDKLIQKAIAEGKTPEAIALFYTDYYLKAEAAMNILPPQEQPRATAYIQEMIQFIERLVTEGYAYTKNGNVFFDVTSYSAYGRLSGNTLEHLKIGARLKAHPDKRHPWDFALWLHAPEDHLMHWPSPWGRGYPGWHIECSAMSLATLGPTIDIHTGGEDNIFPHHEAEIAQSECGNKAPFVRYWVHTRHLLVDGMKMSKSKGNCYTLADIFEHGFEAMDLRMLFLGAHYRSQMNFTWDALTQAKTNRLSLMQAYERLKQLQTDESTGTSQNSHFEAFQAAIEDDLNTPQALSIALDMAKLINSAADKKCPVHTDARLQYESILFEYFGLTQDTTEIPTAVSVLLETRKVARQERDFARSDALRDEIARLGYSVEDSSSGQVIRKSTSNTSPLQK